MSVPACMYEYVCVFVRLLPFNMHICKSSSIHAQVLFNTRALCDSQFGMRDEKSFIVNMKLAPDLPPTMPVALRRIHTG